MAYLYQTVSKPTALVIAGVISIGLLTTERKSVYKHANDTSRNDAKREAMRISMRDWQHRWDMESRGRWAAILIGSLEPWVLRKHGEVDYFLTRFLLNHGLFIKYLHRMRKTDSLFCIYWENVIDDAEHTFHSQRWEEVRQTAKCVLGEWTPETIIPQMLVPAENWVTVSTFIHRDLWLTGNKMTKLFFLCSSVLTLTPFKSIADEVFNFSYSNHNICLDFSIFVYPNKSM